MAWSQYVESESVTPLEGITDDSVFRATLLDSLNAIHLQLKLLNVRFEELGQTGITEKDL